jgi:hypothetical protein
MAAGKTYEPIETQTLSSNTSTVTFSSVPQTYTDLIISVGNAAGGDAALALRFNGDTGTNYSSTHLTADGSNQGYVSYVSSNALQTGYFDYLDSSNTYGGIMNIQGYTNSNINKTVLVRGGRVAAGAGLSLSVGMWRNTAAITSISIVLANGGSINTGSTFTLYGIAAA